MLIIKCLSYWHRIGNYSSTKHPTMKTVINTFALIATLALVSNASAQTVYNITKNTQVSALKFANDQCNNCVINISEGVTLTINQEIFLQNTVFNGGTIAANKKITFWAAGESQQYYCRL